MRCMIYTDRIFKRRILKRVTYIAKNICYSSEIYVDYKFYVNIKNFGYLFPAVENFTHRIEPVYFQRIHASIFFLSYF